MRVIRTPARSGSGRGPVSFGNVLNGVVSDLGLSRDLDDYRIWVAWDEVVGPAVARNAQPVRLDTRRLVVAVKNAMWMQELTLLRRDLCSRLNDWMGREVVSEVFLVIGRVEAPPAVARSGRVREAEKDAEPRPADGNTALERLGRAVRERDQG